MGSGRLLRQVLLSLVPLAFPAMVETASAEVVPSRSPSASYPYLVAIECPADALAHTMRSVSDLFGRQTNVPTTIRALRRRVEADLIVFRRVARSEGYYDAGIHAVVDGDVQPAAVTVTVEPGPRYKLADVVVEGLPPELSTLTGKARLTSFGIDTGVPATGSVVSGVGESVLLALAREAYPFARVSDRHVVVDHNTRDVRVRLTIDSGALARIGSIEVVGLHRVSAKHVLRRIDFAPGDRYHPNTIEDSRLALRDTRLFSSVRIAHAGSLNEVGVLPVTITVVEAPLRSYAAGASYSSVDGVGVQTSWEHRSLLGGGELMRVAAKAAQTAYRLGAAYREPDFLSVNTSLLLDFSVEEVDTDAFDKTGGAVTAALERQLTPRLVGTWGVSLEQAEIAEDRNVAGLTGDVVQVRQVDDFTLVGLPLTLRYDTTDDILDATRGLRASFSVVPYASWLGSTPGFVVARAQQGVYFPLLDRGRLTLAGRTTVGTLFGERRLEVPADKRFYAGGAGSVRGYEVQNAESLVPGEDPDGGRSLFQFGAELRWRVWGKIAVVPFVEAAQIDEGELPRVDDLFWGAGLGLRYHSPVGPLRFDVATPIERRDGIDHYVEFYLSFGQAF